MSALASAPARRPRPRGERAPARRADLHVVPRPRHTGRYVALLVVMGAVGVFGIVSLSALAAESAFSARALESEIEDLSFRYDELTAEVAALESPGRVRAVAITQLGMVPAQQPAYLVLDRPITATVVEPSEPGSDDGSSHLADPLRQALGAEG